MAMNYRRLGNGSAAVGTVLLGVMGTAVAMAAGFVIKANSVAMATSVGLLVATITLARQLQGPAVETHRAMGGKIASRWLGAGIGLLVGLLVFGSLLAYFLFFDPPFVGTRLAVGANDEIYYSGSATEADARALGDALTKQHFFGQSGATVQLDKSAGKTTISLVVKDGAWDNSEFVSDVRDIIADIAPAVGGLPITLKFLDSEGESHKEVAVTEPRKKRWSTE
jgi:hypothetical protein